MTNSADETSVREVIGYYIDGMRNANVATLDASGWQVTKGTGLFPKEIASTAT